jgi:hypothetical protein
MTTEPPEVLSPPSETPEWKPPPEFELIKELNGHAGRLATLLGLVVAALALSMSNGPIKDALTGFDLSAHAFVYGALLLAGLCIYSGAISAINALDPAAPVLHRGQRARDLDDHEWLKLVIVKQFWTTEAVGYILGIFMGFFWHGSSPMLTST